MKPWKRWLSFIISILLFMIFLFGYQAYQKEALSSIADGTMAYTLNYDKFFSYEAMCAHLDDNIIPVFGSSELSSLSESDFYPSQILQNSEKNFMFIGAGNFQSLSHAITLGAMQTHMNNKKVVLIISPQWFVKDGIQPEAFASKFSEDNFIEMLKNKNISDTTKGNIIGRVNALLSTGDPTMYEKVQKLESCYMKRSLNPIDYLYCTTQKIFTHYKSNYNVLRTFKNIDNESFKNQEVKAVDPDWSNLLIKAGEEGKKLCNNEFDIMDDYYEKYIVSNLDNYKNSYKDITYTVSKEYDDLCSFLNVCKDTGIEPLLVSIPVNGLWYDYAGFSKEDREVYYENIRNIAKQYDVKLADFSDYEYETYFLKDIMHIGWKGWVRVSESIYKFM